MAMFDEVRERLGSGSRRHVLRGLLGIAAMAMAGGGSRNGAEAHPAGDYCAETAEQEMLRLINEYRAAKGLAKLSLGQRVGAAAQHHSADMANRDYFSHTTQGTGEGPQQRMLAHGYAADTTWWGENIYAGYGTRNGVDLGSAQAAFDWWKNSPGHNANMLNARYVVIGIDRSSNPTSQYRNYWTTDFGGRGDDAATLCGSAPTPTPAPTRLAIVAHQQSSNSTGAGLAYDGDPATAWRTSVSGTPSSAWLRFDLGGSRSLTEIRWQFSQLGSADKYSIQVSANGSTWQTLATRGNAGAVGAWETLSTTVSARYVRFHFANPNRDRRLGYLSEVQLFGLSNAGTALRTAAVEGGERATAPALTSEDAGAREPVGHGKRGRQARKRRQRGKRKRS